MPHFPLGNEIDAIDRRDQQREGVHLLVRDVGVHQHIANRCLVDYSSIEPAQMTRASTSIPYSSSYIAGVVDVDGVQFH